MSVWTYFIQAGSGGNLKIGISGDPEKRKSQRQTGNPHRLSILAVVPGDYERYFHHRLRRHRLHGEWFRGEPIREFLASPQFESIEKRASKGVTLMGCAEALIVLAKVASIFLIILLVMVIAFMLISNWR